MPIFFRINFEFNLAFLCHTANGVLLSQSVCSIFSDDVKKYSTRHFKKLTKYFIQNLDINRVLSLLETNTSSGNLRQAGVNLHLYNVPRWVGLGTYLLPIETFRGKLLFSPFRHFYLFFRFFPLFSSHFPHFSSSDEQ